MNQLFDEYPTIEGERLILRKPQLRDAEALKALTEDPQVYRYLPTFLFETKYEDPQEVIRRIDEECFRTRDAILLAICLRREPDPTATREPDCMLGLAEIYNYEPKKAKASIGIRLSSKVWGQGIATEAIGLLKKYLLEQTDVRTITAHIMCENRASAAAVRKNGFLNKYPDLYGDWGFPELCHTDKYVFKKEWLDRPDEKAEALLPPVEVEQFVMAYRIEQDRIRCMLPEGFESLRPVLRINTEIRDDKVVYVEFNTPVRREDRRGWLNIAYWKSSSGDDLIFAKAGPTVTIRAPFLTLSYTTTGIRGGCPAERDNDGCFYIGDDMEFRPAERITADREFCDCSFAWKFHEGDAQGKSEGRTIPAFAQEEAEHYPRLEMTAEHAAAIPCEQVLGAYVVKFTRSRS